MKIARAVYRGAEVCRQSPSVPPEIMRTERGRNPSWRVAPKEKSPGRTAKLARLRLAMESGLLDRPPPASLACLPRGSQSVVWGFAVRRKHRCPRGRTSIMRESNVSASGRRIKPLAHFFRRFEVRLNFASAPQVCSGLRVTPAVS